MVRGKKGTHQKLLSALAAEGFVRVRINGELRELGDNIELDKNKTHDIEVVVDRFGEKRARSAREDWWILCLRR